jgi:exosortase/archaeosortase family protein
LSAPVEPRTRPKLPVLRFTALFILFVVLYYAVTSMHWFAGVVFPANLRVNAAVSGWILRTAGEAVTVESNNIQSAIGTLSIKRGCDALEPAALFVAAVLAFPAAWRARAIGLGIGVPLLLVLNLARIVSLYYVLKWSPAWFDAAHVEIWQPLFIFFSMLFWVVWVLVLVRPRPAPAPGVVR